MLGGGEANSLHATLQTLQLVSSMGRTIDCKAAKEDTNASKNRYPDKIPSALPVCAVIVVEFCVG